MYFMVNTAFVNYLDQIDYLNNTLEFLILKNKTTFQQTLPISLNVSKFDSELLTAPKTLKDVIHQYTHKKEIFDLEERHDNMDTNLPNKDFFSNNFIMDVFLFITTIISLFFTILAIYLLCKCKKLRALITSLALQQIKEVGAVTKQEDVTAACTCKIPSYIILPLSISIFGLVIFAVLHFRNLKLCRGHLFANAVKIMLFISYVQKLCTNKIT